MMTQIRNESLAERIQRLTDSIVREMPPDIRDLLAQKAEELARSGMTEQCLGVGDQTPDFSLQNERGELVRLSILLEYGPVVLAFYRGGWCPYCNITLRALQRAWPDFMRRGAQLIAVSPQTPDYSLATALKEDLSFGVLSDVGNTVAKRFGIVFTLPEELRPVYRSAGFDIATHNGNKTFELPLPATYVIDQERMIRYAFVNTDYRQRAEPQDILDVLDVLIQ